VEDGDEVVGGRVIRTFLVADVEAVELREHDPGGKSRHEEQRLDEGPEVVDPSRCVIGEEASRHERGCEADDVRDQQRPPDEPPAPADLERAPTVQEIQRARVEPALDLGRV